LPGTFLPSTYGITLRVQIVALFGRVGAAQILCKVDGHMPQLLCEIFRDTPLKDDSLMGLDQF
jgi:hypothetical protein